LLELVERQPRPRAQPPTIHGTARPRGSDNSDNPGDLPARSVPNATGTTLARALEVVGIGDTRPSPQRLGGGQGAGILLQGQAIRATGAAGGLLGQPAGLSDANPGPVSGRSLAAEAPVVAAGEPTENSGNRHSSQLQGRGRDAGFVTPGQYIRLSGSVSGLRDQQMSMAVANHAPPSGRNVAGATMARVRVATENTDNRFPPQFQGGGLGAGTLIPGQLNRVSESVSRLHLQPPSLSGPSHGPRRRVVLARGVQAGNVREPLSSRSDRERFLLFSRVLLKYLEQKDRNLHQRVKALIRDCAERNRRQEPGYESVTGSLQDRLREIVSDTHWARAENYLRQYLTRQALRGRSATSS
jgi:hypothetical protein